MTLQNRVLPTGEIVAIPARGLLTGNRGILHGADRRLGTARWRHPHWISCVLEWKGVRRTPMTPGTWTELFFLDEAVAMAAGHRPCALCRRPAFRAFQAAWQAGTGLPDDAARIDRALHPARVTRDRRQVRHRMRAGGVPEGGFLLWGGQPCLRHGEGLLPYAPTGYGAAMPLADAEVTVLTPLPLLAAFAAGYRPVLHPSVASDPSNHPS